MNENAIDLYKLPISTLKNAKIFNFSGKLYDKIYKEALEIEKDIISKKPPLEKKIVKTSPTFSTYKMREIKIFRGELLWNNGKKYQV